MTMLSKVNKQGACQFLARSRKPELVVNIKLKSHSFQLIGTFSKIVAKFNEQIGSSILTRSLLLQLEGQIK